MAGSPKGYIAGLLFQYASASSFTVTSGAIDILGKLYAAASTITVSGLSGLGANTNQYIKAGAPSSGRTFGLAQVSLTATAPTWSDTYLGWYCGNDRVIGWLRTDASGNIRRFFVGGGVWSLVDSITEISTTSPHFRHGLLPEPAGAGQHGRHSGHLHQRLQRVDFSL